MRYCLLATFIPLNYRLGLLRPVSIGKRIALTGVFPSFICVFSLSCPESGPLGVTLYRYVTAHGLLQYLECGKIPAIHEIMANTQRPRSTRSSRSDTIPLSKLGIRKSNDSDFGDDLEVYFVSKHQVLLVSCYLWSS